MKTVFAIGDSWFNYFFTDLNRVLLDRGFAVQSVALPGDTLQSIASRTQIDPRIPPQLDRLQSLIGEATEPPLAIVLSAGGDDVVALDPQGNRRLKRLLNRAAKESPALNDKEVSALVDGDLRTALATVLAAITGMCNDRYPPKSVPILIHGYAHPVADGRRGPFGQGPWLGPSFAGQGYGVGSMKTRRVVMTSLIDRLNEMQIELAKEQRFSPHVKHVDLRDVLSSELADYRKHWENELHPTRHGFQLVGNRLSEVLTGL